MPKKRPEYRADRVHSDFLTTLKDHLPSIEDFESKIEQQLHQNYDVNIIDEFDINSLVDELYSTASEKELKLLVRTRIESVDEHLSTFLIAKEQEINEIK